MSIAKSGGKFVWDFYKLGLGYALQRNNTFSIKHTGPDIDHKRRPMLHYVVVKKSRK